MLFWMQTECMKVQWFISFFFFLLLLGGREFLCLTIFNVCSLLYNQCQLFLPKEVMLVRSRGFSTASLLLMLNVNPWLISSFVFTLLQVSCCFRSSEYTDKCMLCLSVWCAAFYLSNLNVPVRFFHVYINRNHFVLEMYSVKISLFCNSKCSN